MAVAGSIGYNITTLATNLQTWTTESYEGEVLNAEIAATTIAFGQLCYRNLSGKWALADATVTGYSSINLLGICLQAANTDADTKILLNGFVATSYATNSKVGEAQFMDATAGNMSNSAPIASGNVVRIIGNTFWTTALQTNAKYILRFNPDNTWIELT
jgi:hypothetical protein